MAAIKKGGARVKTPTNAKTGAHLQAGMPSPPRNGPGSFPNKGK